MYILLKLKCAEVGLVFSKQVEKIQLSLISASCESTVGWGLIRELLIASFVEEKLVMYKRIFCQPSQ